MISNKIDNVLDENVKSNKFYFYIIIRNVISKRKGESLWLG
jgi:hypothetical protein